MSQPMNERIENYRPVSVFAQAAIVFAILACSSLLNLWGLLFVIPTIIFAIISLIQSRRYEQTGARIAFGCILFSIALLFLEPLHVANRFWSESPAGYQRVSFEELIKAGEFNSIVGEPVCLKGYALFNRKMNQPVFQFLLSVDGNQFTSGRVVYVQLEVETEWKDLIYPLAISGVLVPFESNSSEDPDYILKDAIVRKSKTEFLISQRVYKGC